MLEESEVLRIAIRKRAMLCSMIKPHSRPTTSFRPLLSGRLYYNRLFIDPLVLLFVIALRPQDEPDAAPSRDRFT
jgi:hypothetical protein